MNGFTRCAYRRLELAHVYRDTANSLQDEEGNNSAIAKFFKNKAYYEKARANAFLEILINDPAFKNIGFGKPPTTN